MEFGQCGLAYLGSGNLFGSGNVFVMALETGGCADRRRTSASSTVVRAATVLLPRRLAAATAGMLAMGGCGQSCMR